ncbi:MAG TPA: alpha-hydroxy acid oxidase [Dehalococcoidia bacterium]|nr:alpha-hydroxy acid oxidase [Dehalococcoidia bacterium]
MHPVNVRDYESIARDKLDRQIYDFIAGGAEDEYSLVDNVSAWSRLRLLPRVLRDVTNVDTATEVLGQAVAAPILLAPVAYLRAADPEGERAVARAAADPATIMVLSTMSTVPIEEVAATTAGPRWFQLYVYPEREITKRLVQRAEAAGYNALCLTVDVPYLGRRERDLYNHLQFPAGVLPANFVDMVEVGEFHASDSALAAQAASMISPAITWDDVDWLRSVTSMPVVLKGILAAADARIALEHGVAGIIVSNHGGRQLDGVPAPVEVLPDVLEAVSGRVPVLVDGGIRRGTDVLKALALGAQAVLIGRPYVWGLAVEGEAGVRRVIRMLQEELRLAMALCGCRSVGEISRELLRAF